MTLLTRIFTKQKNCYQHINPDGSMGGFVPTGATVSSEAFVGKSAVIMDGAKVGPGERIDSGEIVTPQGRVIRFGLPSHRVLTTK